ncbi:MAG: hypothetical protein JST36_03520 [Bacteroidetes bacterium]|nr:hypothetical protein [Bacteroidota bacterium]
MKHKTGCGEKQETEADYTNVLTLKRQFFMPVFECNILHAPNITNTALSA